MLFPDDFKRIAALSDLASRWMHRSRGRSGAAIGGTTQAETPDQPSRLSSSSRLARRPRGRREPEEDRPLRPTSPPAARFPDHELPDPESVPRTLSEIQGDDPLILTLARGHYRPKEHQQHLELAAFYPKITVAHTQIATIATDDDSAGVPRTEEA